jgi:heme/copper-type cytochrome/quinol oxidase subunit 2
MKRLGHIANSLGSHVLAIGLVLALASVAAACPTCKDQLAHDPASANLARGYAMSIVFMLSMPPLIFGSLCAYFYWEVCKARARQAAGTHAAPGGDSAHGGLAHSSRAEDSVPLVPGH